MSQNVAVVSGCNHSNHLFTNPFCADQTLLRKIGNVVFHILTFGIPLITYCVISCCFPRRPSIQANIQVETVLEAIGKKEEEPKHGPLAKADELIKGQPHLTEVSAEEVLRLQNAVVNTNEKHELLNLKEVADAGFLPTNKFAFGEATYYFSKCFSLRTNDAVLALVKIGDKVFPRIFYRSNSQATWRTMPAVVKIDGGTGRLGKGHNETDTQLPIAVNLALLALPPAIDSVKENFMDLVKSGYDMTKSYEESVHFAPFAHLVADAKAYFCKNGMYIPRCPDPKAILLTTNEQLNPDFSSPLHAQEIEVPYYKKIQVRIYASKDKSLQYMYYEANDGRAFLAAVEKVTGNPITRYGNRQEALELHSMDAPLLEYWNQIPEEYVPSDEIIYDDSKPDIYKNNWNFVRECKLVQMYYAEQGRTLPDRL